MAKKITAQVLGGQPKTFDGVDTIEDLKKKLTLGDGYAASVNGEPADDDYELNDYEFVSLAPAVKGGHC